MAFGFDTNEPLAAAYFSRNPTSIIGMAALALKRKQMAASASGPSPDLVGSNNAAGLMPTMAGDTQGGQRGFSLSRPITQNGIYQNDQINSPMNSIPQYGGTGDNVTLGGSPISFAAGGMMTPSGGAIRPGNGMMETQGPELGATPSASPQQVEQEAQAFVQQHPEEVQKIQQVIAYAMQTGELTPEELNMAVQLAKTALASPQSYPQIRQFAIKNGLGTEQDIPQQMDQGLLYVLIVAGKSMAPEGNAMQGQGPSPTQQPKPSSVVPEYDKGGMTGSKTHIAKLHPREYVIPEDALIYHGKKHFDKLVEQARTPPDAGTN